MIKKTAALTLAILLTVNFSGCQLFNQPSTSSNPSSTNQPTTTPKPSISFDYQLDDSQIDTFGKGDTFNMLAESSPYYLGAQPLHVPVLQDLNEQKQPKVAAAIQLTKDLFDQEQQLRTQLHPFQDAYLTFIGTALKEEPKLQKYAKQIATQYATYQASEDVLIASIQSIDTSKLANPLNTAMLEYQKTTAALKLNDELYHDLGDLLTNSAQLDQLFSATANANIKTALNDFEAQLEKIADLNSSIDALNQKATELDWDVRQIKTADYYSGLAALSFMRKNAADLEQKIAEIQPNDNFSADDIAFLKTYTKQFESFGADLQEQANQIDQKELIPLKSAGSTTAQLIPLAKAEDDEEESSFLDDAYATFKYGVEAGKEGAKLSWNAAKDAYGKVQTGVGVTLDTANVFGKIVVGGPLDLYYGASVKEINQRFQNDLNSIGNNYEKGTSGSEVLKTAKEYLENTEKLAGDTAEGGAEKVFGKGMTSWTVGKAANLTVDLFTTLGKGIYLLANKESTTGDYVHGSLDVLLTFIGGSKLVVKGSQILKGAAETAPAIAEGGMNLLGKIFAWTRKAELTAANNALKKLETMTAQELEQMATNELEIQAMNELEKTLIESGTIKQKLIELAKSGWNTLAGNAGDLGKNFKDFISKAIAKSLTEYTEKGASNGIKELLKDYFDNLIGDVADNALKDNLQKYVDENQLPGTAPNLKDLAGKLDDGQFVINDVAATPEFEKTAKEQGCDIGAIEDQKGKPQKMSMSLTPTSDSGGTLNIIGSDGKVQSMPFTYENGAIKATMSQDQAVTTIEMSVTQKDGKYQFSGPMNINYQGDALKISADASASKAMPAPTP